MQQTQAGRTFLQAMLRPRNGVVLLALAQLEEAFTHARDSDSQMVSAGRETIPTIPLCLSVPFTGILFRPQVRRFCHKQGLSDAR